MFSTCYIFSRLAFAITIKIERRVRDSPSPYIKNGREMTHSHTTQTNKISYKNDHLSQLIVFGVPTLT